MNMNKMYNGEFLLEIINKKKTKTEKSEKHKNICFLNVCCVMML